MTKKSSNGLLFCIRQVWTPDHNLLDTNEKKNHKWISRLTAPMNIICIQTLTIAVLYRNEQKQLPAFQANSLRVLAESESYTSKLLRNTSRTIHMCSRTSAFIWATSDTSIVMYLSSFQTVRAKPTQTFPLQSSGQSLPFVYPGALIWLQPLALQFSSPGHCGTLQVKCNINQNTKAE